MKPEISVPSNPRSACGKWKTYGSKILQQHGWHEGVGLGATLQGPTTPIPLAFKADTKGVGCKNTDGNWIGVQNEFSDVLKMLTAIHATSSSDGDSRLKEAHPVSSLPREKQNIEVLARERGRLFYHKHVKSKDVRQYKASDLQKVLGVCERTADPATKNQNVTCAALTTAQQQTLPKTCADYFSQKRAEKARKKQSNHAVGEPLELTPPSDLIETGVTNTEHSKRKSPPTMSESATHAHATTLEESLPLKVHSKHSRSKRLLAETDTNSFVAEKKQRRTTMPSEPIVDCMPVAAETAAPAPAPQSPSHVVISSTRKHVTEVPVTTGNVPSMTMLSRAAVKYADALAGISTLSESQKKSFFPGSNFFDIRNGYVDQFYTKEITKFSHQNQRH